LDKEVKVAKEKLKQAKEELKYADMGYAKALELTISRIQSIQEHGSNKYSLLLDLVFTSNGLTDFINKATSVSTILAYDQQLSKELKDNKKEVVNKKELVEKELNAVMLLKAKAKKEEEIIKTEKVKILVELKKVEELQRLFLIKEKEEIVRLKAEKLKQEELARLAIVALENEKTKQEELAKAALIALEAEQLRAAEAYLANEDEEMALLQESLLSLNPNATAPTSPTSPTSLITPTNSLVTPPNNLLTPSIDVSDVDSVAAKAVILEMSKYLGVPYLWGGMTPEGFDCSGLMQYAFKKVGVNLPRVSYQQQNFGVKIPLSEIQAGDLIFIHEPATHVALYIGSGLYMHARMPGDVVKISKYDAKYWHTATRVIAQ
jgi:cell wall-associated NlpC family hydrolase